MVWNEIPVTDTSPENNIWPHPDGCRLPSSHCCWIPSQDSTRWWITSAHIIWTMQLVWIIMMHANVIWKSWLFPCAQSSFWARCWVLMKPLQRSYAKLKLHRDHDTLHLSRATQLETGLCNKCLKHTLESYSTATVQLSRGCSLLRCCMQRQLWGWAPLGPDPHTTCRFLSARPRITLGYSHNKRNQKRPRTNEKVSWATFLQCMKLFIFMTSSFWKDIILIQSVHMTIGWIWKLNGMWVQNRARVEARRYSY